MPLLVLLAIVPLMAQRRVWPVGLALAAGLIATRTLTAMIAFAAAGSFFTIL